MQVQYVLYLLKYEMLFKMRDLYCLILNFQENAVFTQMQDDFNVQWGAQIKRVCQGKMYLSKSKMTPQK